MTLGSLLIRWLNWRDRFVPTHPRLVHKSNDLLGSPEASTHATELASIENEIRAGNDLTPRLSTRVGTAYVPSSAQNALNRRADLDLLLSDWGIHHLHLVPAPARSGPLLFVVFRPGDAYLLLIRDHTAWNDVSLIETIVRNWPNEGLVMGPVTDVQLSNIFDDADRKALRQGGVTVPVEVDGQLYVPRGLTMCGTAGDATQRSNAIMCAIQRLKREMARNPQTLDEQVAANGERVSSPGDWHPHIDDDSFGFINTASGAIVDLVTFMA